MWIRGESVERESYAHGDADRVSLIFHFTHDAGKPSPSSSKELHISTVWKLFEWHSVNG